MKVFFSREQRFSICEDFEYLRRFFSVENKDLTFVKVLSTCEVFFQQRTKI